MIQIVENPRLGRLKDRLLQRDVTVEEVWEYITIQHQPHAGQTPQSPASFVTQEDLVHFWSLHDWWEPVKDKPTNAPTPLISQFCWYVNTPSNTTPVTFMDAMMQFYNRALAWCQANDLDPAYPGETVAEKRKRLNRERMAKVRGHRPTPRKVLEADPELAAQVKELEEQCSALKVEAKLAEEWAKGEVLRHQEAMIEAAAKRKEIVMDFKTRIEKLRTEIRTLIAKQ